MMTSTCRGLLVCVAMAIVVGLQTLHRGLVQTPYAKLEDSRNNKNEDKDMPLLDDVNDTAIQAGLYYVAITDNTKHEPANYLKGLGRSCRYLAKNYDDIPFVAVGDQDFIKGVPECSFLESPPGSNWSLNMLNYETESQVPIQTNCSKKVYNPRKMLVPSMVRVWLNKLDVLCGLAEPYPDRYSVIMDAALSKQMKHNTLSSVMPQLQENKNFKGLALRMYHPSVIWRLHFGLPDLCHQKYTLFGSAAFLAIRGRDCPVVKDSFRSALHDYIENDSCPCFDEEKILSHAMSRDPELYTPFYFYGGQYALMVDNTRQEDFVDIPFRREDQNTPES